MKKLTIFPAFFFVLFFLFGAGQEAFAQVLVNNGGLIFNTNDTIFVNGGVINQPDITGTGGTFSNSGQLYIKDKGADPGDWVNSAGNAGFSSAGGVDGASQMTCYLLGGNQNIQSGSVPTEFSNLRLRGTGVKQLLGNNAIVHDTLDIKDRELATGAYKMTVTNTDPNAIEHVPAVGFVSSTLGGSLVRNTNSAARYLFPVGSSVGTTRYRPIEVGPKDNFPNTYGVRMANVDATTETFPVNQKQATINYVNNLYYHWITRDAGFSPASLTVYYDPATDGSFTGIGHWQNAPEWENIMSDPDASKFGLTASTSQSWDFSLPSPAFALIKLFNECGEMFVPTAFSPDGNGENDMECVYGKCVKNIYFAIYDRWGEKVFETTNISQCWDGTFRGKEMNTAVFVYYMKATLTTGEEVVKKGNISLFR
jgi:gliding motility-associated-like protein